MGERLSGRGRALRLGAAAAALAGLAYGTFLGSDDGYPFGPLSQYAFAADPNGSIPDLYVEAETDAGTREVVKLSPDGVGIARAEIEGQLPEIIADPSRLQAIADAQRRLHPDRPRYTHLWVRVHQILLRDGAPAGERTDDLTEWAVR